MTNLGIMVSGGGTNLQAIIDRASDGYLDKCRLCVVISSKRGAHALLRAEKAGIACECVERKAYQDIELYDKRLIEVFDSYNVDLIVMAGFLSLVGREFIDKYKGHIINVHPSLIPAFSGSGCYGLIPHQKALDYGVKLTGATVHFVEYEVDSGPIIMQKAVEVLEDDTPEILQKRVMEEAEWKMLPEAIKLFSEGRLKIEGRRVTIL
ncbi:MAG: phosphoribosylglycinamide formyltransferase [Oscillospiraceae bacterium]|nr:phosphoribosylglycinamide formyltransferase [Oscillospiraceae bacterium]